jgi:putative nucleotidyltransferase with HDIG domain
MRSQLTTEELEKKFRETQSAYGMESHDGLLISIFLSPLRVKSQKDYEHCMRVGLKAGELAEHTGVVDPAVLYRCGTFHDVGKKGIRQEILHKKTGWTAEDAREMEKHGEIGSAMLREWHEFESEVVRNIHVFNQNGQLKPEIDKSYDARQRLLVLECARLVNIVDFYDAATHRENERNSPGNARYLTPAEVKDVLLRENSDRSYLIKRLYERKIF